MTEDPVCRMNIDAATATEKADHEGSMFHFCSASCKAKFVKEPAKYLGDATKKSLSDVHS